MAAHTLDDLPTPVLILDRAVLRRNLKRMSERLRQAGVALRPHLKTAKSVQVGRMAVDFCPIAPEVAARPGVVRLFTGLTALWAGVNLASAATTFA